MFKTLSRNDKSSAGAAKRSVKLFAQPLEGFFAKTNRVRPRILHIGRWRRRLMVFCSFGGSRDGEMWLLMSGVIDHLLPTPPIYSNYHIFPIHHCSDEPHAYNIYLRWQFPPPPIHTSPFSSPNALNYPVRSRQSDCIYAHRGCTGLLPRQYNIIQLYLIPAVETFAVM